MILLVATLMGAAFIISLFIKRNDMVDVVWGLGFVLIAGYLFPNNAALRQWIMLFCVSIWGIRLALHIGIRNIKKTEDFRYKAWRDIWGRWFYLRSFLQIYVLQGAIMLCVASPIWVVMKNDNPSLNVLDGVGVCFFIAGFLMESIADWQLSRFKANPHNKGKVMQSGLWRYSMHPNYFGEVILWWGLGLVAASVSVVGLLGSVLITLLILKVSGIPMLAQKQALNPDFKAYAQKTSVFFPRKPKF
jgi:steroid 5-alpha reductase family enzyme